MEKCWIFVGPIVHAIFTLANFILIPIAIIVVIMVNAASIGPSSFSGAIILLALISLANILWFPLQILPIFLGAIGFTKRLQKQFRQRHGAKSVEEWDQINQNVESNNSI